MMANLKVLLPYCWLVKMRLRLLCKRRRIFYFVAVQELSGLPGINLYEFIFEQIALNQINT